MSVTTVSMTKRRRFPSCLESSNGLLIVIGINIAVLAIAWVGYIGSDDWFYIQNARLRQSAPFAVGLDHWDVRWTMTGPMALTFWLFGESEISAALTTLCYALFTTATVYALVSRVADARAALVSGVLVATSPLLAIDATSLRVDAVETFYAIGSLACFLTAMGKPGNQISRWMLTAGILGGLAFVTRPTTIGLFVFYGATLLSGKFVARLQYIWLSAGAAAIWLGESLFYSVAAGNFFHRLNVDFNHDNVVRGVGSLFDAVLLGPAALLLTSHSFGIGFWLALPALWFWLRAPEGTRGKQLALGLGGFCIVWIAVFAGFATKLVLDARYLSPALVAVLALVGMWIHALLDSGRRRLAATLSIGLLASHAMGIYVENRDFLYAERWLVRLAATFDEPIYTDPQTYERASFLLDVASVRAKVIPAPSPPGALFLAVPANAARGQYNLRRWSPADYEAADWLIVDRLEPGRRVLGLALEITGLRRWFPTNVWKKIDHPNEPVCLYRRPQS